MRKTYSASFKAEIVQEILKEEYTMGQIAAQHGVHPIQLSKWKAVVVAGLPSLFEGSRKELEAKAAHERQVEELYAEIGRLTTQVAWLKKKSGLDFTK